MNTGPKPPAIFFSNKAYFWLILIAVFASAVTTYYFAVPKLHQSLATIDNLNTRLQLAEDRNNALTAEKVLLEQQFSIIRGANNRLLETENEYQTEIAEINSELAFYRRLAGASGKLEGLTLNKFLIEPTASERLFHFNLTLTQNLQKAKTISGEINISMRGSLANQPALLDWKALQPEDPTLPKFSFKYFQQIEGYITLPENFIPETIEITLLPSKKDDVQSSFSWQESTQDKL